MTSYPEPPTASPQAQDFSLRFMVKEDLPQVLEIQKYASDHEDYWSADRFYTYLGKQKRGVLVAVTSDDRVLGYIAFSTRPRDNLIEALLVSPKARHRGVGKALLSRVCRLKGSRGRDYVTVMAREHNLETQLFLKACGFRCTDICEEFFNTPPDSGYVFLWSKQEYLPL